MEVVKQLCRSPGYSRVEVLVRQPLGLQDPKLVSTLVPDLGKLREHEGSFAAAEDVFCCLGTTIKKAGSQEAFRQVDLDYPVEAARLAAAHGVKQLLVISALGADASSSIFYNRIKGEMERQVSDYAGKGLESVHLFRPSLLLGNRQEFRLGESVAAGISRALPFLWRIAPLKPYKPIHAETVAQGMLAAAGRTPPQGGVFVYESKEIEGLG